MLQTSKQHDIIKIVCAYVHPSVAKVKILVQGRISGTINDRKMKKRLLTYNGETISLDYLLSSGLP